MLLLTDGMAHYLSPTLAVPLYLFGGLTAENTPGKIKLVLYYCEIY